MKKKVFTLLTLFVLCVTGASAQTTYDLTTWTLKGSDYNITDGSGNVLTKTTDYTISDDDSSPLKITSVKKSPGYTVCISKKTMPEIEIFYFANNTAKELVQINADNYVRLSNNNVKVRVKNLQKDDLVLVTLRKKGNNNTTFEATSENLTSISTPSFDDKVNYRSWLLKVDANGDVVIDQKNGCDITTIEINPADVVLTAPSKTYTTYCSAKPLDFSGVDGLEAYVISEIADSKATMKKVSHVASLQGIILKKTGSAASYDIPVLTNGSEIAAAAAEVNKLKGITSATALTASSAYILHDGTFVPAAAGTLPAGKAYIAAGDVSAPILSLDFGDVTAIKAVDAKKVENNVFFNLAGQQVAQPTKGLYIVNGKKVIIK